MSLLHRTKQPQQSQSPQSQPPQQPQQSQPLTFIDRQIAERAYTLWQARQSSGQTGTEAEDWEAAKESLTLEHSLPPKWRSFWSPTQVTEAQKTALELHKVELEQVTEAQKTNLELRKLELEQVTEAQKLQLERCKLWISGAGVIATVLAGLGLLLTYRTGQEQQRIAQQQLEAAQQERQLNSERLVTDRFAKAVEQLGSPDIDVRIGAIYSLERIAKDSPKDHWTIMEVLMAFVRNKSPLPKDWTKDSKQEPQRVAADVQSALTVIGRRDVQHDLVGKLLDLAHTNLTGADLNHANLKYADLSHADLSRADLEGADLSRADFLSAALEDANLTNADLSNANLSNANLLGANLGITHLQGVKDLTTDQIKQAQFWQDAHYDPAFRQQLGLPPEKLNP